MKIQQQADLRWTPEDFFNDPELDRHTPEGLRRLARVICNHSLECAGDLPPVFSDDAFTFRVGDPVGCLFPDADGFCAMGTVRAIHPDPDGQTERDEFLVELSCTIMGVYHADQLVLRAPSVGQAAQYSSI